MTRHEKIEAILGTISDWDLETLVEYVVENERRALLEMSDEELEAIYTSAV